MPKAELRPAMVSAAVRTPLRDMYPWFAAAFKPDGMLVRHEKVRSIRVYTWAGSSDFVCSRTGIGVIPCDDNQLHPRP